MKRHKVKHAMTWGEIPDIMDMIAVESERVRDLHHKIAAMHRGLAGDIRSLLRTADMQTAKRSEGG